MLADSVLRVDLLRAGGVGRAADWTGRGRGLVLQLPRSGLAVGLALDDPDLFAQPECICLRALLVWQS